MRIHLATILYSMTVENNMFLVQEKQYSTVITVDPTGF
jgi:hypothetical protein